MNKFFDHIIRNREDFEETLEYIRMNPVRRGLVKDPKDCVTPNGSIT
jgi:REP element-mobilizing transposase RayT